MKVIKIGELNNLMQHVTEIKFSAGGVMFKGVYYNPALAENTPFCIVKTLTELDTKEYSQLMDVKLPNGHKVHEVFALIRKYMNGEGKFYKLPPDKKSEWLACHETHFACKHYGGTCNYCHKRHEIITNLERCGFFEDKKNLKKGV